MEGAVVGLEAWRAMIRLIHGDCREELENLETESVDLVITSPPYNVGVKYADNPSEMDKLPLAEYREFSMDVASKLFRVLKHGGRFCLDIGGSKLDFPLTYLWQEASYCAGFGLFAEIGMEHRKTNQCAWGSWMKANNVHIIPNFHMLYVFYKGTRTKSGTETTITSEEFVEWTKGYWKLNWSVGSMKEHPAQFPKEFVYRCIRLFGHAGDTVLDPFMGSGTTGIVCKQHGRDFIGIELHKVYFDLAKTRIEGEQDALL